MRFTLLSGAIEYDHKKGIYAMPFRNSIATANDRMMLVKLACGTVDEETHDDEWDEPEDVEEED